jgi:hypothetical protein
VTSSASSPEAGPAGGRSFRWLRLFLYLAYVGILSAALLELSLRWFLPQPLPQPTPDIYRPDAQIGWRRNADVRIVANTGERDVDICTSASGDRIDCDVPPRDTAQCRSKILVLGDSFVEALAIPYGQSVWSAIERDTGACVFVAGVGGYGASQYARQAQERLEEPGAAYDLVILDFYAGNDFTDSADTIPPAEAVAQPVVHLLPRGLSPHALFEWLYPFNEWLESRSHLYVGLRYAARRLLGHDEANLYGIAPAMRRSGLSEKLVSETLRDVSRIAEETHRAHVPLLVVLIPINNQVLDPRGDSLRSRFPELGDDLDMNLVAERFVPRLAALPGVDQVVDLLPYLREHADADAWGRRDLHFSPAGHALWFEAIRAPVRERLATP